MSGEIIKYCEWFLSKALIIRALIRASSQTLVKGVIRIKNFAKPPSDLKRIQGPFLS